MIDNDSPSFVIVLCLYWLSTSDARFSSISSPLMRPRPSPMRRRVTAKEVGLKRGLR